MAIQRRSTLLSLVKGLFAAILLTLLLMVVVAILAIRMNLSDAALVALNQLIKLAGVLLGVFVCVGRGGRRGFMSGMTLAMLYMVIGYASYAALGGQAFVVGQMLGEVLLGAAVGALSGAVLANMGREDAVHLPDGR